MATEKTPLTSTNPSFGAASSVPFYVQDTYRFYSRRRRERQLQCVMFVTIIATFIMALIVTISYSVNHSDIIPPGPTDAPPTEANPSSESPNLLLQSSGKSSSGKQNSKNTNGLSVEELKVAVETGNAAIAARHLADSETQPLPSPSPNSRHQYAVSTTQQANRLALAGIAEIAATRKIEKARLFMGKPSSFGSYLDGGWAPPDICSRMYSYSCPFYATKYRRFDGACNHPFNLGMTFTPYKRVLPADYADGINAPRVGKYGNPLPSAREVSLKVHPPSPSTNPSFTVMLAVFGQFLDHDITATAISKGKNGSSLSCCPPSGNHPECFPVKVGPGDPAYDVIGSSCMEFVRSSPAAQCKTGPRQQLNQVTAFIDGSTIYGSDIVTAESLRTFVGGGLRMQKSPDNRPLLPANMDPHDGCNRDVELARGRYCFATGDARANENLHLTTMHLLWARWHNRVAERLSEFNPHWDDEILFQETRRILSAQLQHITYQEFLPIVLGETEANKRNLKPLKSGFRPKNDSDIDPTIANNFATAAFRFAHTLLPGLMRVTDAQNGSSSYVQLHKMLFNPYSLYSKGGVESSITSATSNVIQKTSTHVTSQLTKHLFEDPLGNETIRLPCGLDLVSLNIQRGRDHGLPGYTKWRQYCGLTKPLKFDDLKDDMDAEALDGISKLYDNVDDVDLYTGALAELPKGDKLVGPTFTCLIADQFERLQSSDKYWYETADQPGSFSEDQLNELRKTSLARLICDTSIGISESQAQVMRSIGPDNPVIPCEDILQISLEPWRTEIPVVHMTETVVSTKDWLDFKAEVLETINNIASSIMTKKPPPGSSPEDWLAFQKDINSTFTDLKNKFSMLHPKVMKILNIPGNLTMNELEVYDWASIKDNVSKTVAEIMDSIYANKPPPGSLPADWSAYKKKINDSLIDIRKKFKVIHPKVKLYKSMADNSTQVSDIPTIDWTEIKNSINSTIMDVIKSINSSKPLPGSTPADWFAFRKKINDSLSGIKDKFKGLHPKPIKPVETLSETSEISESATFDWTEFKVQLNKSLSDILASINSKKPPTGSTPADWLAFQKDLNDSFVKFENQFSEIDSKPVVIEEQKDNFFSPSITKDQTVAVSNDTDNDVNKTIAEITAEIKASRPPPGSPQEDWVAFQQKLSAKFANMKNKYTNLYAKNKNKTNVKTRETASSTFDAVDFRNNLNSSLDRIVFVIKTKKPALDAPVADWNAYKKEIKSAVSELKKQINDYTKKESVDSNLMEYESDPTFDWMGWKNDINKTIDGLLVEIKTIPPGDPKWADFRDYLNSTFTDFKSRIAAKKNLKPKLMASNYKSTMKVNKIWSDSSLDPADLREGINKSLDYLSYVIKMKKPKLDDPATDWVAYKKEIIDAVSKFKNDFSDFKKQAFFDPNLIEYESDLTPFDWVGWKTTINKTIDGLIDEIKTIPPEDPKWMSFRDYLEKKFNGIKSLVGDKSKFLPKLKLMSIMKEDWLAFRDRINSTIEDTLNDIELNKPPPGDPAWYNYKIYIKTRYNEMRENIRAIKAEWYGQLKAATNSMIVSDMGPTTNAAESTMSKSIITKTYLQLSLSFVIILFLTV